MGMWKVNYKFVNGANKLLGGVLMFKADSAEHARERAKIQLDTEQDWYKITSITEVKNDE